MGNCFLVRRNRGMSVAWLLFAIICIAFAGVPWIIFANGEEEYPASVIFFSIVWSSLPLALGAKLLFSALCRIEHYGKRGHLTRKVSWLGLTKKTEFPINRVYLIRQWNHSKQGEVPGEVLFVRASGRKHRLSDELMCADLAGLLQWIAETTHVKTLDARHRQPIEG